MRHPRQVVWRKFANHTSHRVFATRESGLSRTIGDIPPSANSRPVLHRQKPFRAEKSSISQIGYSFLYLCDPDWNPFNPTAIFHGFIFAVVIRGETRAAPAIVCNTVRLFMIDSPAFSYSLGSNVTRNNIPVTVSRGGQDFTVPVRNGALSAIKPSPSRDRAQSLPPNRFQQPAYQPLSRLPIWFYVILSRVRAMLLPWPPTRMVPKPDLACSQPCVANFLERMYRRQISNPIRPSRVSTA